MKIKSAYLAALLFPAFLASGVLSSDWPVYKGNIYFTGNNDEIIVQNGNLKWLFQADARVFNPVASDGRIYFVDIEGGLYCVNEFHGKLIWKRSMREISSQFKAYSRSAGKVKYPLIQGNILFITDPIAVYAFDKITGKILWARTGMRIEPVKPQGMSGYTPLPMVDGIYSDPVLYSGRIYYGTRNMFLSRNAADGHELWENRDIKSYSGFPVFHDGRIITQSADYERGIFEIYCLDAASGRELWKKSMETPVRIFPPIVYGGKVYACSGRKIHAFDFKDGRPLWTRDFGGLISSIPSFTDRSIIFTVDNSDVLIIEPEKGELIKKISTGDKSGPLFVTIRDQLYLAYNTVKAVDGRDIVYPSVRALSFEDESTLWTFSGPFPGGVSQPLASGGIMFLPAGNYLYAIGTRYYAKVVDGGGGHAVVPGPGVLNPVPPSQPLMPADMPGPAPAMKDVTVSVKDENGRGIKAIVTVRKRENGEIVYEEKKSISGAAEIKIPDADGVEIIAEADSYMPAKVIIGRGDSRVDIKLNPLEEGRSLVVDNINFEINKAYLRPESRDLLDSLAALMKRDGKIMFEIRGHTDSTGEEAYNMKLSGRRADAVAEYLVKNGISPGRLKSRGFGESSPIADNATPEGRALNRRTEFFIIKGASEK